MFKTSRLTENWRLYVETRGHNFKVLKEHSNIICRLNSFVCRNIKVWNSLPAHVTESDSVAICSNVGFPERTFYVVNFLGFYGTY